MNQTLADVQSTGAGTINVCTVEQEEFPKRYISHGNLCVNTVCQVLIFMMSIKYQEIVKLIRIMVPNDDNENGHNDE